METKLWSWLLLRVIPFVRFSIYYTRFEGDKFVEAYKILEPGQFILAIDEKKATTVLVPGFTTHAAYVVSNCQKFGGNKYEVAEMTHRGYTKSYLFTICKEASRILICTCLYWDKEYKKDMVKNISRFENVKYGVNFSLGIKALYCSELIYQLDRITAFPKITEEALSSPDVRGVLDVDLSDLAGLGRPYISPDGLLFASNTKVVWDSDGEFTGMNGIQAEKFCKAKGYI